LIPISIDISDTVEEFFLDKEETDSLRLYILDRVVTDYWEKWQDEIKDNLHSTRKEYQKGMFQDESDEFSVVVGLTPRQSKLAMMIEDGASTFDIKSGMEQSAKKKIGKGGNWYITVPFRLATSGAIGESEIFSGKMPKPIEKLAKKLEEKQTIQFDNIPKELQGLGRNNTSGYNHKFNIYEGIQRVEIGSGNEKRGGYMNFRRVSENSDPASWIHPGFESKDLMGKALSGIDVGNIVDEAIEEFLSNR
jgi:hypothetical protein